MTEADLKLIHSGDIGVFAGKSTVSKLIIHYMKEYRDNGKFNIDKGIIELLNGFVPSHLATFFWIDRQLYLFGSIESGFKPILFKDHMYDYTSFMIIRKSGYTIEKVSKGLKYAMTSTGKSSIYPYWRLPLWIVYTKTGWKWPMSWGGDKAMECYKSTYEILREVFPEEYTNNLLYASCYDSIKATDEIVFDNRV